MYRAKIHLLNNLNAWIAETPLVDEPLHGIADARIVRALVEDRRCMLGVFSCFNSGSRPSMSPCPASAANPNANPSVNTRSIQPFNMAGNPTKYTSAMKASGDS